MTDVFAHLASCPSCRRRFDRLAEVVLSPRLAEIPCAECVAEAHRYFDAEFAGADAGRAYPDVEAHLGQCAECAEVFQAIRSAVLEAQASSATDLPFALSFVESIATPVAASAESAIEAPRGQAPLRPESRADWLEPVRRLLVSPVWPARLVGRLAAGGIGGVAALLLLTMGVALAAAGVAGVPPVRGAMRAAWNWGSNSLPDIGPLFEPEPTVTATPSATPTGTSSPTPTVDAGAARTRATSAAPDRPARMPARTPTAIVELTATPTATSGTPAAADSADSDRDAGGEAYPGPGSGSIPPGSSGAGQETEPASVPIENPISTAYP